MYATDVRWEWVRSVAPTLEPLTIADLKAHARITHDREDGLLLAWITAARRSFENYTRRAVLTQTWIARFGEFVDVMPLPMAAPLQPVAAPVVQYYDGDGTLQTLATTYYLVNTTTEPGQIERAPAQAWPAVQTDRLYPVVITYIAGWTSADLVPEDIKQGLRLWVAAADADRLGTSAEGMMPALEALWSPYRLYPVPPGC